MVYRMLIFLCLLVPCQIAFAFNSAEDLLSACKPLANAEIDSKQANFLGTFSTGECWGVFSTIQKVIVFVDAKEKKRIFGVCAPPSSTRTQLIAVFVAYAEKNPQRLNEDFFDVAISSLQEAFPCKGR